MAGRRELVRSEDNGGQGGIDKILPRSAGGRFADSIPDRYPLTTRCGRPFPVGYVVVGLVVALVVLRRPDA